MQVEPQQVVDAGAAFVALALLLSSALGQGNNFRPVNLQGQQAVPLHVSNSRLKH